MGGGQYSFFNYLHLKYGINKFLSGERERERERERNFKPINNVSIS